MVQRAEGVARFEPKVLDHSAAQGPEDFEGLLTAAGAVQCQHERSVQLLVERAGEDEGFQFTDQLVVPAEGEIGLNAQIEDAGPEFFEAGHVRGEQRAGHHVDQRGPAPQGEGTAQRRRGPLGVIGLQ